MSDYKSQGQIAKSSLSRPTINKGQIKVRFKFRLSRSDCKVVSIKARLLRPESPLSRSGYEE